MSVLDIVILVFILLETVNVIVIYFKPDFKYANGMYAFKTWDKCQQSEDLKLFSRYMANWVAGSKIVFILLLAVILFTATEVVKVHAAIVMAPAIATYYIKLHPIIRKLDKLGQLRPRGYSKILILMITGFISMFAVAVVITIAK